MSRGFSAEVHAIIDERATDMHGVVRCERCGEPSSDLEHHHRRPRGMGSTRRPESNQAANGGCLCGACHRITESHRLQGFDEGWLVRQSQTPTDVPVLRRGVWVFLRDNGDIIPASSPVPAGLKVVNP